MLLELTLTNIAMFVASYSENVNAPRSDGWTPLHIAAQYGSSEIFKFLAPQVENPNAPTPDGWTPLHIAAQHGSTEIFKFLAPQEENPNSFFQYFPAHRFASESEDSGE